MKTYITEQEFEDQKFEGPDIQADSWAEAETAILVAFGGRANYAPIGAVRLQRHSPFSSL